MPEPSPALIDTIARALYDHRESLATESWTGWHHLPESWREEWRGAARAALAAMPQPIANAPIVGFNTLDGSVHLIVPPENIRAVLHAFKASAVVALVPVEGNPA